MYNLKRLSINFLRPMSSLFYSREHVDVTAGQFREKVVSTATVANCQMISKTIKFLILKIHHPDFTVKAGQWVDFFVPGMQYVGGYSVCSSVRQLELDSTINLAVKESTHPTAAWIHKECKQGDRVTVRVGGDFVYNPQHGHPSHDLLLVAGGVGINPIISICQHAADLCEKHSCTDWTPKKVSLLYSSKYVNDLIFKEVIEDICIRNTDFNCTFFVTREDGESVSREKILARRIQLTDLLDTTSGFTCNKRYAYLCGPSQMIDDIVPLLNKACFDKSQIFYEKWW